MLSSGKEIFMGKQAKKKTPKCMESDSIQNYSKDTQFVSKKEMTEARRIALYTIHTV